MASQKREAALPSLRNSEVPCRTSESYGSLRPLLPSSTFCLGPRALQISASQNELNLLKADFLFSISLHPQVWFVQVTASFSVSF